MELNRILIIENDPILREREAAVLEKAGYKVERVADTFEGIKKMYESYPDLIVVARDLPKVNGEESYLRVRKASYLPIIVVGSKEEAPEALQLGADAYMTREPALVELVARVRNLLRRKQWLAEPSKQSGSDNNYNDAPEETMDDDNGNGANYLNATEFRLVSCLVLNKGRLLDYQRLISEGWEGEKVDLDTLHTYMRRLRQKLPAFFPYPIDIFNYQDVGYCLTDSLEEGLTN